MCSKYEPNHQLIDVVIGESKTRNLEMKMPSKIAPVLRRGLNPLNFEYFLKKCANIAKTLSITST